MYTLPQLLWFAAVFLVVPVAIVLGHQRPTSPIVVTSFMSLAALTIFWFLLGGFSSASDTALGVLLFSGGLLLQVAAWTLALNAATLARNWGWVLLLVLTGYISFAGLLIAYFSISVCFTGLPSNFSTGAVCLGVNPVAQLIFNLTHLLVSAIALVFGLVPTTSSTRQRRLPAGRPIAPLPASPVDDGSDADTEPDPNRRWTR